MKLPARPHLGTGLLVVALLGCIAAAHLRLIQCDRRAQAAAGERTPAVVLIHDIRLASVSSIHALESSMLFGLDAETSARFQRERGTKISAAQSAFSRLLEPQLHLSSAQAARARELQDGIARLRALEEETERLYNLDTPDGTSEATELLRKQVLPFDELLSASLNDFATSGDAASEHRPANEQSNRKFLAILWSIGVTASILAGLFSVFEYRRADRSLQRLSARADRIASGDLTGAPLELPETDRLAQLADTLQVIQESFAGTMAAVAESAAKLAGSASNLHTASAQLHLRMEDQAARAHETAPDFAEISASLSDTARHTETALATAATADQAACDARSISQECLNASQTLRSTCAEASDTLLQIDADSHHIAHVLTAVQEITRQTSVLTMNAQIEAARAGDLGRAFAVIAAEIRHLAGSTADAGNEIAATLRRLDTRSGAARSTLGRAAAQADLTISRADQALAPLEQITLGTGRLKQTLSRIAQCSARQLAANNLARSGFERREALLASNASEFAQTSAALDTLRRTSAKLRRQVERFLPPQPDTTFAAQATAAAARAEATSAEAIASLRATLTPA